MKQIFSWTVGSFFRTIGRIIAFLVVGCLIAYILSDNGFRVDSLFLDSVKADDFISNQVSTYYKDVQRTTQLVDISGGQSFTYIGYRWNSGTDFPAGATGVFRQGDWYFPNVQNINTNANTITIPLFMRAYGSADTYKDVYTIQAYILTDTGKVFTCQQLQTSSNQFYGYLTCPISKGSKLSYITANFYWQLGSGNTASAVLIGLAPFYTLSIDDTSQNVINNNNNNTQNIINNILASIVNR